MNKLQIKLIIGLMSISLVGIILVQYLWIKNAIEVKEKQFDNAVFNSMNSIVSRLDRYNTIDFITNKVYPSNYNDSLFSIKEADLKLDYYINNLDSLDNKYITLGTQKWVKSPTERQEVFVQGNILN